MAGNPDDNDRTSFIGHFPVQFSNSLEIAPFSSCEFRVAAIALEQSSKAWWNFLFADCSSASSIAIPLKTFGTFWV